MRYVSAGLTVRLVHDCEPQKTLLPLPRARCCSPECDFQFFFENFERTGGKTFLDPFDRVDAVFFDVVPFDVSSLRCTCLRCSSFRWAFDDGSLQGPLSIEGCLCIHSDSGAIEGILWHALNARVVDAICGSRTLRHISVCFVPIRRDDRRCSPASMHLHRCGYDCTHSSPFVQLFWSLLDSSGLFPNSRSPLVDERTTARHWHPMPVVYNTSAVYAAYCPIYPTNIFQSWPAYSYRYMLDRCSPMYGRRYVPSVYTVDQCKRIRFERTALCRRSRTVRVSLLRPGSAPSACTKQFAQL